MLNVKEWVSLLDALTPLLWPAVFIFVFLRLQKPIKALIDSARGRKFTVKVGGNELSMEEVSEQQRVLLADVQAKLAELETRLTATPASALAPGLDRKAAPPSQRLLWVDDKPKNNSTLVATLEDRGHRVDIALSTEDALAKLQRGSYDTVISDMGRPEGDKAGIVLAQELRRRGITTPLYIYCGAWAARNWREEALAAGAADITASGTTLLAHLLGPEPMH